MDLAGQPIEEASTLGRSIGIPPKAPHCPPERRSVPTRATDFHHGGDFVGATEELVEDGAGGVVDIDEGSPLERHEERTELTTQLLAERDGTADHVLAGPQPSRESFDLSDRQQRDHYLADRMRGVTAEDLVTYDSGDFEEE